MRVPRAVPCAGSVRRLQWHVKHIGSHAGEFPDLPGVAVSLLRDVQARAAHFDHQARRTDNVIALLVGGDVPFALRCAGHASYGTRGIRPVAPPVGCRGHG